MEVSLAARHRDGECDVTFYADLHIHSKYSRACSRDCDLEHLAWWAARKGVSVLGTGDFTHPAWGDELRERLVPAEPGLFRLRPEVEEAVMRTLPPRLRHSVRFMLSVEISTIYKRDEHTRKVHHCLYAPTFEAASRITADLAKIGNLASDGRPILGLDSRDLLEITLESDAGSYLVPAHVWTPWFSALGSKSGFDAIADCYADLADHVFAVETGLSSDPLMNWRVSSLDHYRLVSSSDAHSPPALAREASAFASDLDYYSIREALKTGQGYAGTVEFFPEEGKYHLDGHRKCGVRLDPAETRELGGRCPVCGGLLTVGVLSRVEELATYPEGRRPAYAADYRNLVPLPEILGEIRGVGPRSKTVTGVVSELVAELGPELEILDDVPLDDIAHQGGEILSEAIARLRRGEVVRDAGFDGEYGAVRMFAEGELLSRRSRTTEGLFALPDTPREQAPGKKPRVPEPPMPEPRAPERDAPPATRPAPGPVTMPTSVLDGLDPEQRAAAAHPGGPLLIVAGPGTGKTRTVTHRIAHLVAERGVAAEHCLAITFTRRAAAEMRERLAVLLPHARPTVTTFHGLGALILRENAERAGLTRRFRIADESEAAEVTAGQPDRAGAEKVLRDRDMVDYEGLLAWTVRLLGEDPALAREYRLRWPWISVDEYQDVDETQYALLRLLTDPASDRPDGGVTVIGDPDQAIYSFRGADVGFFLRFTTDFPAATSSLLSRNYRSAAPIVNAALAAIAPSSLVPGRRLEAQRTGNSALSIYTATDPADEASQVVMAIDRLLGGSSFHSLDSGRADGHVSDHFSLADVAILYRTDAQATPVVEALTTAGVPFQKRSHDRLATRPWVAEIGREMGRHPDGPLADRLAAAARALIAERGRGGPAEVGIRFAADLLTPLALRCGDELPAFLTELTTGAEVDAYDPRADRVALLTLHAAKGLEFPVVFIVGCEEGLLPLRFGGAPMTPEAEAEERRLFFVGLTRARSRLFLSHAARRRDGAATASRFLDAIPAELLERTGERDRAPRHRQLRLM